MRQCRLCALRSAAFAQAGRGRGGAPQAPATNTVAPAIPGVVAAGTPVTVIKEGFQGTEGPITLPDGSVIFSEPQANRISKIDKDGNVSVFLENSNGSNGLAFDSKGRLISTQTAAGQRSGLASSIRRAPKPRLPTTSDGRTTSS